MPLRIRCGDLYGCGYGCGTATQGMRCGRQCGAVEDAVDSCGELRAERHAVAVDKSDAVRIY